jgi:NADPH:quinone reductase-like Zn-dependent oxidoreductase
LILYSLLMGHGEMIDSLNMRALMVDSANAPLRLVCVARPVPQAGQVLVRIQASGVNPLDGKIRSGQAAHAGQPLPAIVGMDLAGTVEALGEGVSGWLPGDEVYAMATGIGGIQGSLAEYAAVDARLLARKPRNLSMREAAGLPLVLITAWEGLVDRARVRPGQKVLIHGGAGGVGHVAVQIARAFGAEVFATGSAGQQSIIEGFGATFIDYRKSSVEDYVAEHTAGEGFDIVYDTVGGRNAGCVVQGCPVVSRSCAQLPGLGATQPGTAFLSRGDLLGRLHFAAAADGSGARASRRDSAQGGAVD